MDEKKELSLDYLEELDGRYSEQKEITVNVETPTGAKQAFLKIDVHFHPKKIKDCIKELLNKMDVLKQFVSFKEDDSHIIKLWLMLLMTKYFSTLDIPSNFKNQLAVLEKLSETNVLFQIFASFPNEEIKKVIKELDTVTHIAMTKIKAFEPLFEKLEENI